MVFLVPEPVRKGATKRQDATAADPFVAHINGVAVPVRPSETLLEAALRNGLEFPHGCRVGGCGSCKCRLLAGRVTELTETAYLLSGEEIRGGYILGCQSVPKSDVRIEVDTSKTDRKRRVSGRIVGQEKVTHDITRLTVQLAQPLAYQAGQFARISLEALPDVWRCYSFAAPARADGLVEFYVRKTPGGALSSTIEERPLVGTALQVEGPLGDFWLRPGDAAILMVAGGSGLPPLLAMLEEAAAAGVSRPVTLLFGAREQRDLYAAEAIAGLARRWPAEFRFLAVLSAEAPGSTWTGARGLLAEHLPAHVESGADAYLCGPPGMVDSCVAALRASGVPSERIRCDRFTTDAATARVAERVKTSAPREQARPPAQLFDYLKYSLFHVIGLSALVAVLAGGQWITLTVVAVLSFYLLGDAIGGDDTSTPSFRHPGILTLQLWLALPLVCLIVFASVWSVCPGDPLGFGAWLTRLSGYDLLAARDATSFSQHVYAALGTGLMIGMSGTIPAHELTHRTWDRVSMIVGRWLLAFSFDTSFAIEHVYGHHRYVATTEDPATAPRGRSVYVHVIVSTLRGNWSAWKIEAQRLAKRNLGLYSWHNAFLRGQLMSALLLAAAYAMGGMTAALYFAVCALWGKALLEIVNYMEHYGLVRDGTTPVEPRHSWNTNRRVSSWALFNLSRHSHHHAQGEVPFHHLQPYPEAPNMIGGYLTTLVIALIPPLWQRLMARKLREWDRDHASPQERELAAHVSGAAALRRSRALLPPA
jgi:NAD(P)H-flavin reductase/ferredoxin/fatty-acid desaturase